MNSVSDSWHVVDMNENVQDVGQQYFEVESRLETLRIKEDRLQEDQALGVWPWDLPAKSPGSLEAPGGACVDLSIARRQRTQSGRQARSRRAERG